MFDTPSLFVLIPIGIVSIGLTIVTLWMLIHAITKPITHKALWILLIVFTGPIGAFVYLFTGRNSAQDAYLNLAPPQAPPFPQQAPPAPQSVPEPVAPIYTPPIPQPPIPAPPAVQPPPTPVPPVGPPVTEGVTLGTLASEPIVPPIPSPLAGPSVPNGRSA